MLSKANKLLSIVIDWIIGLIMGSIVAILFVGVILRYVFNTPLFWSEEVAVLGLIWITFLGGAILTRQDKHVSITILSDMCPRAMGRGMQILSDILVVIILVFMVWQSWALCGRLAFSTTPALRIKESWFGFAMVAGFLVMLYYQVQRLWATLLKKPAFPETKERDKGVMV